jgi:hypothetical protein
MSSKFAVLDFEPRAEAGPGLCFLADRCGLRCKAKSKPENECTYERR